MDGSYLVSMRSTSGPGPGDQSVWCPASGHRDSVLDPTPGLGPQDGSVWIMIMKTKKNYLKLTINLKIII